jgi:hypothetical protein
MEKSMERLMKLQLERKKRLEVSKDIRIKNMENFLSRLNDYGEKNFPLTGQSWSAKEDGERF